MKMAATVAVGTGSLLMPRQVFAQLPVQPPMGPFGRGGWGPWGWWGGGDWVTWLAIIAPRSSFILWIVERRKGGPSLEKDSPLEILKSRYARGEIDRREFDEKRRDLL